MPILPEIHLPRLTGQVLADVVLRKGVSAGSLDGWGVEGVRPCLSHGLMGLLVFLLRFEDLGVWPDGLLDAYIT